MEDVTVDAGERGGWNSEMGIVAKSNRIWKTVSIVGNQNRMAREYERDLLRSGLAPSMNGASLGPWPFIVVLLASMRGRCPVLCTHLPLCLA